MAAKPSQAATANSRTTQSPKAQPGITPHLLAIELADCAGLYEEHGNWQSALFAAIHRIVTTAGPEGHDMPSWDRSTVAHLASLGEYLGETGYDRARHYADLAKEVREGGAA